MDELAHGKHYSRLNKAMGTTKQARTWLNTLVDLTSFMNEKANSRYGNAAFPHRSSMRDYPSQ
jgi:hypothetical protein